MSDISSIGNPYQVSFQIHEYRRTQHCRVCQKVLASGNHVVTVAYAGGQMAYLGHEEGSTCCGKLYWTFATYEAEFQARIAIETYERLLNTTYQHGIRLHDVVPVVGYDFKMNEESLKH
jgi:hypothetical protein